MNKELLVHMYRLTGMDFRVYYMYIVYTEHANSIVTLYTITNHPIILPILKLAAWKIWKTKFTFDLKIQ